MKVYMTDLSFQQPLFLLLKCSLKTHIRRLSNKFVDFVNEIKRSDAISLNLLYVCNQFDINKLGKCHTNRLINVVAMTICSVRVSATCNTPRC